MIPRYTRPEIGAVWSQQRKLECWLEVELAATEAWAEEGAVPAEAAEAARANAAFTVEAVNEREKVTDHDVAAFVDVVAASVGEHGRWIHYGLTSSDVLDTALALQLRRGRRDRRSPAARAYRDALIERALEQRDTLCVGRTHGVHAEPTTFGLRLAGFAFEADRNLARLERRLRAARLRQALRRGRHLRLGAAGGRGAGDGAARAAARGRRHPGHPARPPRGADSRAIALAGAGLERFATEVRNLQRTEVREVEEPFGAGQKGSSAMPHKRNPIRTERITGLARVLRGYAQTGLENVALWHERDISHSGAERVILPDATIGLDYMQHLATKVAGGMTIHAERMRENLELTHGALFSQRALTALVESGHDPRRRLPGRPGERPAGLGHAAPDFRELLGAAAPELDLDAVFDYDAYLTHCPRSSSGWKRCAADGSAGPTRPGSRSGRRRRRAASKSASWVITGIRGLPPSRRSTCR